MKPLLIVLDDWEGQIEASPVWPGLRNVVDVRFLKKSIVKVPESEIKDAEFLMAIRERTLLNGEVFSRLPGLKLVLQTGGHAYHIDVASATRQNITIALGRHVAAPLVSVPELTMAMALNAMHLTTQAHWAMREGRWPLLTGRSLSKRRLGILGMGRHGSKVAHIARHAFDMDVVAWERPGSVNSKKDGIARISLNELLETSDVVSVHLRLSEESRKLLNLERLNKMKQGAVLINTARGAIVDEQALIEVLKSDRLAGACLDVFEQEPLAADSPLRSFSNVMLTPHIGWTVEEVFQEFAHIAGTQLMKYLNGTLDPVEVLK